MDVYVKIIPNELLYVEMLSLDSMKLSYYFFTFCSIRNGVKPSRAN